MKENFKTLRIELIKGSTLKFSNKNDLVAVWFSKKTSKFCIELNGKVIDSIKTFEIFKLKLQNLLNQKEIEWEI